MSPSAMTTHKMKLISKHEEWFIRRKATTESCLSFTSNWCPSIFFFPQSFRQYRDIQFRGSRGCYELHAKAAVKIRFGQNTKIYRIEFTNFSPTVAAPCTSEAAKSHMENFCLLKFRESGLPWTIWLFCSWTFEHFWFKIRWQQLPHT